VEISSEVMNDIEEAYKRPHDAFFFLPGEKEGTLRVEQYEYKDRGEEFKGNLGNVYHIFFFGYNAKDQERIFEFFEAVLIDPITYIKRLLESDIYGGVARKTTTSHLLVDRLLSRANLNNVSINP
jgi:hypothetical protein